MNVLRLPTDCDLSEAGLLMAVDVMQGAGDGSALLHLMVSPRDLASAKRLVVQIAGEKPKSLIGLLASHGQVEANYAWTEYMDSRWMLIGQNNIVYTAGAGR